MIINEMDSIRSKYKQFGVKDFYTFHGGDYKNPHELSIKKSIDYIYDNWNLDFSKVLDLAAGKGEITKILEIKGIKDIEAVDGYLSNEYMKETGKKCYNMTFDDISKGSLRGRFYSLIICSYALHLLEESKLPMFLLQLPEITDSLLIISPHKKPYIKDGWGWELKKEIEIDRVRCRYFASTIKYNN